MGSLAPPILHLFNSPAGQRPHTRLAFKLAQKTPAHLPERLELQITREEGEGILPGPGRSSEDRRQQRTPRRYCNTPLPPRRRVRPSLRLLHCSSLIIDNTKTDFRRASASCLQNSLTEPSLRRPLPEVRDVGLAQHPPLGATTQVANVLTPAPPLRPTARPRPRRALPATLRRGAGPDSAARGLGEGRNL